MPNKQHVVVRNFNYLSNGKVFNLRIYNILILLKKSFK